LLAKPVDNEVLYLYIAMTAEVISAVLVRSDRGNHLPIYYLSRVLIGAEKNYSEIERTALCVINAARKLRPYFESHKIVVLTNQPLKQTLGKIETAGRLVKWAVELGALDVEYAPRTTIKAQALADFLVEIRPSVEVMTVGLEATAEAPWMLHADGSSTSMGAGVGISLRDPKGLELDYSIKLGFDATNNVAEYEALIIGMRIAAELGARNMIAYTDSQLVAKQFDGSYKPRELTMKSYNKKLTDSASEFASFQLMQIPGPDNGRADALSKYASSENFSNSRSITLATSVGSSIQEDSNKRLRANPVQEVDSWMSPIVQFLGRGVLPSDPREAKRIKARSSRFAWDNGILYKRGFHGILQRCLTAGEAEMVMREIHEGSCGNHSGARSLAQKVLRNGFYWPTIVSDTIALTRSCDECQRFSNLIRSPSSNATPIPVTCPFDKWGIDIVGPFPTGKGQKKFLIVAIEYFTKWVEAEPVETITEKRVIDFLWKNIICRFGLPRELISDNGTQFCGRELISLCNELKIQQNFASVGHPQSNGQVEVTNRTIVQTLERRLGRHGKDWPEQVPGTLWSYRTTPRTATQETPFCLVYGSEAVLPAEIAVTSFRVQHYSTELNDEARRLDLDLLDAKREEAHAKIISYKARVSRLHDRRVRARPLQIGDLVLKKWRYPNMSASSSPTGRDPSRL
jgi:ribonuclease HI